MSTIKRFSASHCTDMTECNKGDFVEYSDYAQLKRNTTKLLEAITLARSSLSLRGARKDCEQMMQIIDRAIDQVESS